MSMGIFVNKGISRKHMGEKKKHELNSNHVWLMDDKLETLVNEDSNLCIWICNYLFLCFFALNNRTTTILVHQFTLQIFHLSSSQQFFRVEV